MSPACNNLKESFVNWLSAETSIKDIGNGKCQLSVPLLDRHNDYLQMVIEHTNDGKLLISDDGYMIHDLELYGIDISTRKRSYKADRLVKAYGAKIDDTRRIVVESTTDEYPARMAMLIQAMLTIGDLLAVDKANVDNVFKQEVEMYFRDHRVTYDVPPSFTGITGLRHNFDFEVRSSATSRIKLIKTINSPSAKTVKSAIFSCIDLNEIDKETYSPVAVLNDREDDVSTDLVEALSSYNINAVLWSERNAYLIPAISAL